MRIEYLKTAASAVLISEESIRKHRNKNRHKRIIADYRSAHVLCERCLVTGACKAVREIHHVQRVSDGGKTEAKNLLALCAECHRTIDDVPQNEQLAMKGNRND